MSTTYDSRLRAALAQSLAMSGVSLGTLTLEGRDTLCAYIGWIPDDGSLPSLDNVLLISDEESLHSIVTRIARHVYPDCAYSQLSLVTSICTTAICALASARDAIDAMKLEVR